LFKSNLGEAFKSKFAEDTFINKYKHEHAETWPELVDTLVEEVCGEHLTKDEKWQLKVYQRDMKFIPGGRYLYYAGRRNHFYSNCYLLRCEEDTREDWAQLSWKAERCLTVGGGIGSDYTVYRHKGSYLHGTGGVASGPISKMRMVNEQGREIMQGGSRRSAIYASLNWQHGDIYDFLHAKDWSRLKIPGTDSTYSDAKKADFNFSCPLDMTNISTNYDTAWLMNFWKTGKVGEVFLKNCKQAMMTGEPGFSFNFFNKENETLRNACTEVTSEDDSDVCNLGSINLARINSISELYSVVELATKFLLCGTLVAQLPYDKVYKVREKNRRLGLGLMGVHDWLLQRGYRYEVPEELHKWLEVYMGVSRNIADTFASVLSVSAPIACRAVAPTGSIGILASTTTGIEPVYAVAIKRRYLKGTNWKYQYVVDETAKNIIDHTGIDPSKIECSVDLAKDYKRRLSVQANIQEYVDMSISSTINLPAWGSELNNEDKIEEFANTLAQYSHRLRGFTVYPDGSRGGQPLVSVPYNEAINKLGIELEENTEHFDICELTGTGHCGL
jgi:ribonucleoside-diphosphate reductase alpha chain